MTSGMCFDFPSTQFALSHNQSGRVKRLPKVKESLNYIKQLGLKDNLCLSRGFSMETLCPHEYDIPLVRGGHLEGPHVFGFLICAFVSEL